MKKLRKEKISEDLETCIGDIKNGKMNKRTIPRNDGKKFLLRLLNTEERKKLEQQDEVYMKTFLNHEVGRADVPAIEWNKSESNLKFALSYCERRTYFIDL